MGVGVGVGLGVGVGSGIDVGVSVGSGVREGVGIGPGVWLGPGVGAAAIAVGVRVGATSEPQPGRECTRSGQDDAHRSLAMSVDSPEATCYDAVRGMRTDKSHERPGCAPRTPTVLQAAAASSTLARKMLAWMLQEFLECVRTTPIATDTPELESAQDGDGLLESEGLSRRGGVL